MRLRTYLRESGLSLSQFAAALRVPRPVATISRWSNGIMIPSPEAMADICEATGGKVRPDDFYGLSDDNN